MIKFFAYVMAICFSWVFTCAILYFAALCFAVVYSLKIATGVWLLLLLLSVFFRPTIRKK